MRPLRFRGWSLSLRRGLYRTPRYGLLTQTLLPGQVVLPPGSPLTDEEAERMNGGPSDILRIAEHHWSPKPPELEEELSATVKYMQLRYGNPTEEHP